MKRDRTIDLRAPLGPDALKHLVNIGPNLREELEAAGIHDAAALRKIGAVEAFKRTKHRKAEPRGAEVQRLLRLQGAILGKQWSLIDEATQKRLCKEAG